MRIHWLRGGIIDATCGLVHIQNVALPLSHFARSWDM